MAGIYLHIPFCKQACHYCNFHFSTSTRYKDDVIQAIATEASLQKNFIREELINTIYFGGGTPSMLEPEQIKGLLNHLKSIYPIHDEAEVTIEVNPDDITFEKLQFWIRSGINRLSIGIQSFYEEELRWMNRAHNATQAYDSLLIAREHFDNISIDLIYGSPLLTDEMWAANVNKVLDLGIPHLSCYALTVEEKTPLHKMIHLNKSPDIDNNKQASQFSFLMQWLRSAGYEHYEVSNFAKPGFRSLHNSSYWKGDKYLGLGPSAHSYDGHSRQWNISNNQKYIASIRANIIPAEKEVLSLEDRLNEYIMISLRTSEGLELDNLRKLGCRINDHEMIKQKLEGFVSSGHVLKEGSNYTLTDEGMLKADGIASDLFIVNNKV